MKRQIGQEEESNKKTKTTVYNGPSAIKTIASTPEFQKLRKYKSVLEYFFGCIHRVDGYDEEGNECKVYPHLVEFSNSCERIGEVILIVDSLAKELNDEDLDWDIGFFSAILDLVVRVYDVLKQNEARISEPCKKLYATLSEAYKFIASLDQEHEDGLTKLDHIREKLLIQFNGIEKKLEMSGWDIHDTVVKDMPLVQIAVLAIKDNAVLLCKELLFIVEVPLVIDFVTQDGDLELDDIKLCEKGYFEYDDSELSIQDIYDATESGTDDMYKYCPTHKYLKDSKNPYDKATILV
jgi:hypothetical protein